MCLASRVKNTPLSERVRGGETVFGGWLTAPGPIGAHVVASAGLDYVVIDLQHGGAAEHHLPAMTAAIRAAGATPLARVRYAHPADIGRPLDLGCEGVIVPQVESAEQAAYVAGACRYPPVGYRSAGGVMMAQDPLCIVMVESRQAMAELPDTLTVPGVDGIYVGPRDLSYALGCKFDPQDPVLRPAFEQIWANCAEAGKPVGVHASDGGTARTFMEGGCRLVTVIVDAVAMARGAATALAEVKAGT